MTQATSSASSWALRLSADVDCPEVDYDVVVFDAAVVVALQRFECTDDLADIGFDAGLFQYLPACAVGEAFAQVEQAAGKAPGAGAGRAAAFDEEGAAIRG